MENKNASEKWRQTTTSTLWTFQDTVTITPISPTQLGFGYSPVWNNATQSLYFVDFVDYSNTTTPNLYRYDYPSKKLYSATINGGQVSNPSFLLPINGTPNTYLLSIDRSIVILNWDGVLTDSNVVRTSRSVEQISIYDTNHFDRGKVDPKGRLVAGTFRLDNCVETNSSMSSIYLFKESGDIVTLVSNLHSTAGMRIDWNIQKVYKYFD